MFENVSHSERSDTGLLRHNNEDSYLVVDRHCTGYDWERLGLFFTVADGLGGHAAGEIASRMACEGAASLYYNGDATADRSGDDREPTVSRLERTLWSVHHHIVSYSTEHKALRGMGTTLSALVLTNGRALIAHVGNSRIYRFRNNACEQLTVDHTENQLLIDSGKIRAGEEGNHCYRHIITQALGGGGDLNAVHTGVASLRSGDRFLLCTDGLHDLVEDREIENILAEHPLPRAASDALVEAAIRKGGYDDVTVMVIQM